MKNKKFVIIAISIAIITIASFIFMIYNFIGSKDNDKNKDNNTNTEIVIDDLTNEDNIKDITTAIEQNNNNSKDNHCSILTKYSEEYPSVIQWMIETMCSSMNANDFIINEAGTEYGNPDDPNYVIEYKEVSGLEKYGTAENYITSLMNEEYGYDIGLMFQIYCPKEFDALNNTYILGLDSNPEYDETSSNVLANELITLYEEDKYSDIISKVDELLKKYKFTMPYNYEICNLYNDAKVTQNNINNFEGLEYNLDYMYSIEGYFINFMKLEEIRKYYLIKDTKSLIPCQSSKIHITSINELDLDNQDNNWLVSKFNDKVSLANNVVEINYKDYNFDNNQYYDCIAYVANYNNLERKILTICWNDEEPCYLNDWDFYNNVINGTYEFDDNGNLIQSNKN